jgi:hypothetical protein
MTNRKHIEPVALLTVKELLISLTTSISKMRFSTNELQRMESSCQAGTEEYIITKYLHFLPALNQ